MKLNWDAEAKAGYDRLNLELLRERCVILAALGALLFPLFSFLDFYTQRFHIESLSALRFSTTAVFIFTWLGTRNKKFNSPPLAVMLFLFVVATFSITFMCVVLGGFASPYYAGINLILIAAALILPVGEKEMAFFVSVVIGTYLSCNLIFADFTVKTPLVLVNNLYFLLGTGVICITSAYINERVRKESFSRFFELERAQSYLQRELVSSRDDIHSMLKEISERRIELEGALLEAEQSREEARKTLKVREDFISVASHELNTPLTALKLQTLAAQLKINSSPESEHTTHYKKLVEIYDAQLKRLIRMVDDMLDVTRIKKGKLELEKKPTDLAALLRDVVESTPREISGKTVAVELLAEENVEASVDPYRIEQVFLNLLTNAMKYGAGKPVQISLKRQALSAEISFRDQGIGISPEMQGKVFEQFERAVKPQEFTGLGLGLFICREIIDAHQGRIILKSVPGEGSDFRVILPLK